MTKSAGSHLLTFTEEILNGKLHISCSEANAVVVLLMRRMTFDKPKLKDVHSLEFIMFSLKINIMNE